MSILSLFGEKNTLKRSSLSDTANIAAPQTAAPWIGGTSFYTSYVVAHSLGYIPEVRVFFANSDSDGKIYPAGGRRLSGFYPGLAANQIICLWEVDATNLTITLESNTTKTGTRDIWWVIYLDTETP